MSNAGLWLLQVLRTEASSSCQLRNKYQIAWWRVLEKRTSQQSANCHRADALLKLRVATARGLIQDNPTRRVFGLLALLHVLLTIDFLPKPLRRKHFHFHVLACVCLLCRMQRLKQFWQGKSKSLHICKISSTSPLTHSNDGSAPSVCQLVI